jgi:uncharacterized glyoxalase superfamily metalloenzyme YdcJ
MIQHFALLFTFMLQKALQKSYTLRMERKHRVKNQYSLSPKARQLIEQLAEHLGVSMSAAVEAAIRALAKAEGIK